MEPTAKLMAAAVESVVAKSEMMKVNERTIRTVRMVGLPLMV
jgi:hypothetical protein